MSIAGFQEVEGRRSAFAAGPISYLAKPAKSFQLLANPTKLRTLD